MECAYQCEHRRIAESVVEQIANDKSEYDATHRSTEADQAGYGRHESVEGTDRLEESSPTSTMTVDRRRRC